MVPRTARHKAGQKTRNDDAAVRDCATSLAGGSAIARYPLRIGPGGIPGGTSGSGGIGGSGTGSAGFGGTSGGGGEGGIGSGSPPSAFQSDHIRSQAGMAEIPREA